MPTFNTRTKFFVAMVATTIDANDRRTNSKRTSERSSWRPFGLRSFNRERAQFRAAKNTRRWRRRRQSGGGENESTSGRAAFRQIARRRARDGSENAFDGGGRKFGRTIATRRPPSP